LAGVESGASFGRGKESPEKVGTLAKLAHGGERFGALNALEAQRCFRVARQLFDAIVRYLEAKVASGDLLDLLRLVENNRRVVGQQAAILRLFQGQVGKEEVMIRNDDVGLGGALVHPGDEATVELLALLPGAGFAARVNAGPQRARVGQAAEFRPVAGLRATLPVADLRVLVGLRQAVQRRLLFAVVQVLPATLLLPSRHMPDPLFR